MSKKSTIRTIRKILSFRNILGITIGCILGFLYWYFIGCNSGTCPINSSPYLSILWGALIGWLLFSNNKEKKQIDENSNK